MKNFQKGFVVPLLLTIIALLIIGGGVYFYMQKHQPPTVVLNEMGTTTAQAETANQATSTHSNSSFTASQTLGSAPLTVTLTYSFDINAMGAASDQFLVDFGDGTSSTMNVGNVAQVTHTYTSAGTYIATIGFKNSVEGPSNYVPLTDSSGKPITQTIVVTNSLTSNITAQPSCTIQATPSTVTVGEPYTISWSSQNATKASVVGPVFSASDLNGSYQETVGGFGTANSPTETYSATVTNASGSSGACSVSVMVNSLGTSTATIDQMSASGPSFTLTGNMTNSLDNFSVVLVNASYSGATDLTTIYQNHLYVADANTPQDMSQSDTTFSKNRWSATFVGIPSGTYVVLVYANNGNESSPSTPTVTGTLTVNSQ
jgi:hypothetical protein